MTLPRVLVGVAAVVLLLAGCAPAVDSGGTPTGTASADAAPSHSATPTPTPSTSNQLPEPSATPVPLPASIVLSFEEFSVRDAAGVELDSAAFTDSDAVLALLSYLHGWTPVPEGPFADGFGVEYRWPDVYFLTYHPFLGTGTMGISSAEVGGLPVSTPEGIHVGSTRAEVEALNPFRRAEYAENNLFGLDPRELPGTESYWYPGLEATSFILVQTNEGRVFYIFSRHTATKLVSCSEASTPRGAVRRSSSTFTWQTWPMTLPRVLVGVLTIAILLTGCAPTVTASTPSPSPTPEPTASPTPEIPVPTSVLISFDALTVLDADGGTLESAAFTDPDAVLALLSDVLGSTPVPIDNHKFGILYEWPGVKFVVNYGTGKVTIATVDAGGLPLSTSQGIHVGSTRAEVAALSPFDANYDVDGDGVSDRFGLDPREVPDSESLAFPGQVGTAFIEVLLQGDVVVSLQSPASDFFDV